MKQESYYMPNGLWSSFQNTQQNCTEFSGMLGEQEKKSEKNLVKKFQRATGQSRKRLLPGSGETDCRSIINLSSVTRLRSLLNMHMNGPIRKHTLLLAAH